LRVFSPALLDNAQVLQSALAPQCETPPNIYINYYANSA
jgi:hypothetical protein